MPFSFSIPVPVPAPDTMSFSCPGHPSLPHALTTHRAVLASVLRRHRHLSGLSASARKDRQAGPGGGAADDSAGLAEIKTALDHYLAYLFAVDASLRDAAGAPVEVEMPSRFGCLWFAPLTIVGPARQRRRDMLTGRTTSGPAVLLLSSFCAEVAFSLSALAAVQQLQARTHLTRHLQLQRALSRLPAEKVTSKDRAGQTAEIAVAMKLFLAAHSVYTYADAREIRTSDEQQTTGIVVENHQTMSISKPMATADTVTATAQDISHSVLEALGQLSLAEATLAAVLKDDPFPAILADSRDPTVKDWMFRSAVLPSCRAGLLSRICLAAADHAGQAESVLTGWYDGASTSSQTTAASTIIPSLAGYISRLRRVCRAKACRLHGLDAERDGRIGDGIGWLSAAASELLASSPPRSRMEERYPNLVKIAARGAEAERTANRESDYPTSSSTGQQKSGFSVRRKLVSKLKPRPHDLPTPVDEKPSRSSSSFVSSSEQIALDFDSGLEEEAGILAMLYDKWEKLNDAFIHTIPSMSSLLNQLPSGREYHTSIPSYTPPVLDQERLAALRSEVDDNHSGIPGRPDSSDVHRLTDDSISGLRGLEITADLEDSPPVKSSQPNGNKIPVV